VPSEIQELNMSKRIVAAAIVSISMVLLGLGCLKMDTKVMIYPNGSAGGSVIIGMEESFWNMSGGLNETGMGNISFIDTENATVRREGGWVYIESGDMPIDDENLSVQVTQYGDYTEYVIEANMSSVEDAGNTSEVNMSDPFTQMMLSTMSFNFTIEMPGEIVDSNAHSWSGNRAMWTYTGMTISSAENLYAKSHYYGVPERTAALLLLLSLGYLAGRFRRR
jgi:hypothetical protein